MIAKANLLFAAASAYKLVKVSVFSVHSHLLNHHDLHKRICSLASNAHTDSVCCLRCCVKGLFCTKLCALWKLYCSDPTLFGHRELPVSQGPVPQRNIQEGLAAKTIHKWWWEGHHLKKGLRVTLFCHCTIKMEERVSLAIVEYCAILFCLGTILRRAIKTAVGLLSFPCCQIWINWQSGSQSNTTKGNQGWTDGGHSPLSLSTIQNMLPLNWLKY